MKTKIVYTVVSGRNDIYMAQAIVSGYTTRHYNPNSKIFFVVDQDTNKIVKEYPAIEQYSISIVVVNVPHELSKVQRSRYLKTTLRKHIDGNYLYIDTDTVITCDLSEIDEQKSDIAAVLDRHVQVEDNSFKMKIERDVSQVGLKLEDLRGKYFNSGVLFVRDVERSYRFYEEWHNNWIECVKRNHNIDQPPLAKANIKFDFMIEELSGIWNCQMVENFVNYLPSAKILHYFATNRQSPYQLYDDYFLHEVKELGDVPSSLKQRLEKPREFFRPIHFLIYGKDIAFYHSFLHIVFTYHDNLFRIFDYFAKCIIKKRLW